MKKLLILLILSCCSSQINAQKTIESIVREGIGYHDNGNYDDAIRTYKKALDLDAKSTLVNYEISMSYFAKGDYEKAIKYADVVLKQKSRYMLEAYIVKGSSLDMVGRSNESIKLFEKAIKQTGGHYLLHFNLALNYYKLNNLDKAEENVIKAIELNGNHASSHLMLAKIHLQKRNVVQTILAAHYFLLLEPNSNRSPEAYEMLMSKFGANVSKDPNKPNTININIATDGDSQFMSLELMIGMLVASNLSDESGEKTEDELFVENTTSFFKVFGELKKEKSKGIFIVHFLTSSPIVNTWKHTACTSVKVGMTMRRNGWLKMKVNWKRLRVGWDQKQIERDDALTSRSIYSLATYFDDFSIIYSVRNRNEML
jgi:tetratricopeptide (TPR) repeat protein